MINIDYKITFQDDLDSLETNNEYSFNRPWVKWLLIRGSTAFLILFGLFCLIYRIVEYNDPDAILLIVSGIISIISGCIFPLMLRPQSAQSKFSRWSMQKQWNKKLSQEEYRNITVTDTEVIFKTEFSELAWKWQAVKNCFEGNKGFILWFFSEDSIYIPKRIFCDRELLTNFKNILEKYHTHK